MTWLTWAGIALRFIYVFSGLKGLIERWQARQQGREDEDYRRTSDAVKDVEEANRTRNRVDSDDDYYKQLYDKYRRRE